MLDDLQKHEQAIICYQRALQLAPRYVKAHFNLAKTQLILKNYDQALISCQRTLLISPDHHLALRVFVRLIKGHFTSIDLSAPVTTYLIILCMKNPYIVNNEISPASIKIIIEKLKPFIEVSTPGNYEIPYLDSQTHGLLATHLQTCIVANTLIENFLCLVRKFILNTYGSDTYLATQHPLGAPRTPFCELLHALATQGFLNEYIWHITDEENRNLDILQSAIIQTINNGAQPREEDIFLLAAYRPLYAIKPIRHWALNTGARIGDRLKSFLKKVIFDSAAEEELAQGLEQLTSIDDDISLAARSQYEQNPFPRWDQCNKIETYPYTQYIRLDVTPNQSVLEPTSDTPKVLIAGCGTGKQPLLAAARYANSDVLAIDLSTASLAYAKRKAAGHGVSNISFAQADILKLGELDNQFDIIECSGVLHHMENPQAGLAVLLSLLKPKGFIKLALYSERARQNIVALRNLVAGSAPDLTTQGIRNFRYALRKNEPEMHKKLQSHTDFYSTSETRDLLFHVQEHRFTIPQLEKLVQDNKLEFLGFCFGNNQPPPSFTKMFQQNPDFLNLQYWHQFEQQNPTTFISMYQFWCRKKA